MFEIGVACERSARISAAGSDPAGARVFSGVAYERSARMSAAGSEPGGARVAVGVVWRELGFDACACLDM